MPMVRAMRMLNALESGTLSGAQLETLLTTEPGRVGDLKSLFRLPNQSKRLWLSEESMLGLSGSATAMTAVVASETALSAIVASATAMTAVAASETAMTAVAASETAMTAVLASETAMTAVLASSVAKMGIFNSDTALSVIAASATALAALRAASGYQVISKAAATGAQTIPGPVAGQSYILVGVSSSNASTDQTITEINTRRSGSTRPVTASTGPVYSSDATTVTLCTPLVSPFTFTTSTAIGYTWYFGMFRCDV